MQHAGPIAATAALLLTLAAGCSGHSAARQGSTSGGTERNCGMASTATQVPVLVEISAGSVTCTEALRVQNDYARRLRAGAAPGNGGGGPVAVDGWTCEGYPTPDILRTGRASQCHRGSTRFYAVLPAPTASATP